jgi:hypothetical protein
VEWTIVDVEGSCQKLILGKSPFVHNRTGKLLIVDSKSLSIMRKYCSMHYWCIEKILFILYQETTIKNQLQKNYYNGRCDDKIYWLFVDVLSAAGSKSNDQWIKRYCSYFIDTYSSSTPWCGRLWCRYMSFVFYICSLVLFMSYQETTLKK